MPRKSSSEIANEPALSDIKPLDSLLIKHSSEYQYLFKMLHQFESDGTIMSCYHIPNMARKVLETFLEFHVPSNDELYGKLEKVDFDPHKKSAVYKFTNDHSHATGKGFDPALVAETQNNTRFLLEMIEKIAPDHYAGLVSISA
jgi:wobble nucleotide-excising tRNase